MIRELVLFLLAATPLRRTCSHERCGCREHVEAQRDILRHIGRVASVSELIEARRIYVMDRADAVLQRLSAAGGA